MTASIQTQSLAICTPVPLSFWPHLLLWSSITPAALASLLFLKHARHISASRPLLVLSFWNAVCSVICIACSLTDFKSWLKCCLSEDFSDLLLKPDKLHFILPHPFCVLCRVLLSSFSSIYSIYISFLDDRIQPQVINTILVTYAFLLWPLSYISYLSINFLPKLSTAIFMYTF